MQIVYKINHPISVEQYLQLLTNSTPEQGRRFEDKADIRGMLRNSNLVVSAWHQGNLIGLSRCLTDFHKDCYLSDLTVSNQHPSYGIRQTLKVITKTQLSTGCELMLKADFDAQRRPNQSWVMNPD